MTTLAEAITELTGTLDRPPERGAAAALSDRIRLVRDALQHEPDTVGEAWLAERSTKLRRDRARLLRRLGPVCSDDVETVRIPMQRLVTDLEHHRQRVSDLVYDGVALELGGSE